MAKVKSPNSRIYALIGIIAVVFLGVAFYCKKSVFPITTSLPTDAPSIITAKFACSADKSIDAIFINGEDSRVELSLSDGRKINLPQTLSADGGRYANWDESFVFWNKGNTAFIEEGSATTYADCVEEKSN